MRRFVATLSGLALALAGTGAAARTLPNYDALQDAKPAGRVAAGFKSVNNPGVRVAHQDERTHSPTFIWVNKGGAQTKLSAGFASMAPEEAALAQLAEHAPLYGLSSFESAGARVVSVSRGGRGLTVVTLAQEAAGIEVFRQSLKLLLNRDNEVVAIAGTLSKHVSSKVPAERVRFQLPATEALAIAYRDLTGNAVDGSLFAQVMSAKDSGPYTRYALATYARPLAQELVIPARVKQVLYSLPDALVPAYYVELNTGSAEHKDSDYYAYVVSATDGRLLMRNDLTADADFSYRVFADATPPYTPHDGPAGSSATPHPTGQVDGFRPPFVAPSLVTLQNAPFSQNDPWLADSATETSGNNVDAYADLSGPDGYNGPGDLRPSVNAPGVFDRTMQFDIQPNANAEQIAAAATNLFFVNNWLHDWFYDAGFDEASGNAQVDNYGRGGLGNDALLAEAQDNSGINNANMATPADGLSPRMQMFLFSGKRNARLEVNAPASIAGTYPVGIAGGFGPQTFDVTSDVVAALDESNASGPSTTDACTALTNAVDVAGKIALLDRGACNFTIKLANAQNAGAIGVIVADNAAGPAVDMGGFATDITIPALRVTLADGTTLRSALPGLNVRMFGDTTRMDGTVDNIIVAHEWGHYISNRLIANSAGLVNKQGRSMGEGWADFTALLMVTRPEDINVPSNANWTGAYGAAEYATRGISLDSAFYGIRRVTYSADMAKNALTFRHISDAEPLPTTAPMDPGGLNSEVHNSGEVWATMLWECYVALLRAHPFQEAQDRMKVYLVNGFKLTPPAPTFLEARDALLAAAYANDPADGERFWAAFARRGAGVGAVAPDRYSTNHVGVVESFNLGVDVELVSALFADDVSGGTCDRDGVLDNGETGRIVITVRNLGSQPAEQTSATVFSSSSGVTVGNGGSVRFPAIPVGGEATVSVPVSLHGATTAQIVNFNVALRDDSQVQPGDKVHSFGLKTNFDEAPGTSAMETVESSSLPWSTDFDPALTPASFDIVEFIADLNRAFYGPNVGAPGDIRLITPPLEVSATDPLVLTFRHAYDFEADPTTNYDGAVIELSNDGGATWVDIGGPVYNGTLSVYTGNSNPLQGRNALVGTSANFPAFSSATVDLGTAYAGQTVRIRFRIGSDDAAAHTGWLLDDLAFSGITNTPFTSIIPDRGMCVNRPPVANAGADVLVNERAQVTLSGSASDVDGDTLSYSWTQVSGPAVVLAGADTLTPSFTAPDVAVDTDVVLRLSVSDGRDTASDTVSVRVMQVNRAPTVNAGLDGSVDERASYTLSGSASDADGETLSYLWTQVSGTPVALRDYDKASATFTAPEVAFDETLSFVLTVRDGQGSVSDTVDVVVRQVNRAPMVTASSVTVDERSTATLQATASDPDGDGLTYAWTQVSGTPVVLSGADTATATFSTGEVSADSVLTFRVTVSDGQATATQDVVVNVRHVNIAPTVNAGVDGSVNERASYTLSGSASDADGDTLSYAWVQVAGTPVALSGADKAQATFTAPDTAAGETLTFVLTVSDGKVTASDTVNVVVNNVNRAPMVTASSVSVDERSTATLQATASDPDGDGLTYVWTQVSGTPVVLSGADTATATFSTGEVSADSVLTFRVTVSDGQATATQDVVVNVRHVNVAPTVNAGADGSVNERVSYTLNGSASDADGDTLSYAWVQVAGTPVALSGANKAQATFTAPDTAAGETLTFVLTVSDGKVTASDSVNVVVNNVNRAPVVSVPAAVVDERSSVTLQATASDADGDGLTYSWMQVSGTPVVLSGANTATVSFTTGEVSADSVLTFRVTVLDGKDTVSQDVTVTVRNVNRAPTVNAGLDGSVGEGSSYTLSGSASDLDGDTLSYAWVQVSGTPVGLSGANTAQATFIAPETVSGETLTFVLTVSDGKVTVSDSVSVVVNNANHAPVVSAPAVVVNERSTATLVATASDVDGDALTYRWTQVSGAPVTLSGADTATATFSVGEVSADRTYTFRVAVSDGQATTTRDVVVTVRNVNRGPVANAGSAVTVVSRASASLDGSASTDDGGSTLTYQWTQVGGPWVTLAGADTATPSFTAPDVKTDTQLVFRLVVSDGSLTSEPSTVTVTVSPAGNVAPVAKARIILSGSQASMTLDGSASSDAEGEALTYKWEQTAGGAVQLNNATQAVLSVDVPASGTYSFRLTVTDARGASHNTTVEATATLSTSTPDQGGCSSTGAGAPASVLGLALLGLLRRRRWLN